MTPDLKCSPYEVKTSARESEATDRSEGLGISGVCTTYHRQKVGVVCGIRDNQAVHTIMLLRPAHVVRRQTAVDLPVGLQKPISVALLAEAVTEDGMMKRSQNRT